MSEKKWTSNDIPNQSEKTVIVTGANSGIGYEVSRILASKGAHIIMACRNLEKANEAYNQILLENNNVSIEIMQLDLSNLGSIKKFTEDFLKKNQSLHILCNNAGVMMPPYQKTVDGFELQFGTNHLGHFALTGLLLDKLMKTKNSRIVTQSSFVHSMGKINFNDLNWETKYKKRKSYAQSKLANLLFAYELQRRISAKNSDVLSIACHPGWSRTNLQRYTALFRTLKFLSQKAEMGALPMLYAATSTDVEGGAYYGPDGTFGWKGYPKKVKSSKKSYNEEDAIKLWDISEKLTGITYNL
ncbi:MAG: SDR family oxidoreductase [Candidatus Lokiarchaeota archaeon]|nr:SDR family oxidoreductase [Candidatus Lokiarchaeota archaeon]